MEDIIHQLQKTNLSSKEDWIAVFVLHADESRLSINEKDAGIGYYNFYQALLVATGITN